jgi:hypothetical protein
MRAVLGQFATPHPKSTLLNFGLVKYSNRNSSVKMLVLPIKLIVLL